MSAHVKLQGELAASDCLWEFDLVAIVNHTVFVRDVVVMVDVDSDEVTAFVIDALPGMVAVGQNVPEDTADGVTDTDEVKVQPWARREISGAHK